MDSDSVRDRLENIQISKSNNEQRMEDEKIVVNLEEKEVSVRVVDGTPTFIFHSFDVANNQKEEYLEQLRTVKYNVSLRNIWFYGEEIDAVTILKTRDYLDELGVKRIDSLKIFDECIGGEQISSFIKNFHVKIVSINRGLPDDVLRTLLQLNLNYLSYHDLIQGQTLLEANSQIPQLKFPYIQLSADVFTQILERIQMGVLTKMWMFFDSVPWIDFTTIPSSCDGPLPEERPLLIITNSFHRWFIDSNGNVTKCEELDEDIVEISKCERNELPGLLQSEEEVRNALAKKCGRVYCTESQFLSLFDGIPVVLDSYRGPFPEERPLICKKGDGYRDVYFLLNKDDSIDIYRWGGYIFRYRSYDMMEEELPDFGHTPLQKFAINQRIEKRVELGKLECRGMEEFRTFFEDYDTLPYDFKGRLPERRPLIFEKNPSSKENTDGMEHRFILYEDGYLTHYTCGDLGLVVITPCAPWNRPLAFISPEILREIVRHAPHESFVYSIDLDVFHEAFAGIDTLRSHTSGNQKSKRPLVVKKTIFRDEELIVCRWVISEHGKVRKCEWKDGMATFSRAHPLEFPPILTKHLVTEFFKGQKVNARFGFFIDLDALNQCLEDCEVHEYEDYDLLFDDRLLIFKKTEIRHTCNEIPNDGCECTGEILHFCFVSVDKELIHITWGAEEYRRFLSFHELPKKEHVPPALKTKEMLEYLLQPLLTSKEWNVHWYGSTEDFLSYFKGHMTIDFNHEGYLPRARPLVFKGHASREDIVLHVYWFLREDDLLIKCENYDSYTVLTINPRKSLPPALSG